MQLARLATLGGPVCRPEVGAPLSAWLEGARQGRGHHPNSRSGARQGSADLRSASSPDRATKPRHRSAGGIPLCETLASLRTADRYAGRRLALHCPLGWRVPGRGEDTIPTPVAAPDRGAPTSGRHRRPTGRRNRAIAWLGGFRYAKRSPRYARRIGMPAGGRRSIVRLVGGRPAGERTPSQLP